MELLVSMSILAIILTLFSSLLGSSTSTWTRGMARLENFQTGRAALDLMGREMKPATANPRIQFALTKGELLGDAYLDVEARIAPNSHAAFFATPTGEAGSLVLTGYYLYRDNSKGNFWLRRLHVSKDTEDASGNSPLPVLVKSGAKINDLYESTADPIGQMRPHHQYANWFFYNLEEKHFNDQDPTADSEDICVSTLGSGVIALWFQAFDQQGNAIPSLVDHPGHHPVPQQPILFNSASFLVQANTSSFDNGSTSQYTGLNPSPTNGRPLAFRAGAVPATVQATIVAIDSNTLSKLDPNTIPSQPILYDNAAPNGTVLDVPASVAALTANLRNLNIRDYRVFSTNIKLLNGDK